MRIYENKILGIRELFCFVFTNLIFVELRLRQFEPASTCKPEFSQSVLEIEKSIIMGIVPTINRDMWRLDQRVVTVLTTTC